MTDRQHSSSMSRAEPLQRWLHGVRVDPVGDRPLSAVSISSEDSVSLEELISANFTSQVDDETDLSTLAELDIDDANEDFWKVGDILAPFRPSLHRGHHSPSSKQDTQVPRFERSDSVSSSEESLVSQMSQLTITPKRPSVPPRPASRLSLSSSVSSVPRYRTSSTVPRLASSRSITPVDMRAGPRPPSSQPLSQRASHIPTPPKRLSRAATSSHLNSTAPAGRQRASHIPSIVRSVTSLGHHPPSGLLSRNIFPSSKAHAPLEKPLSASMSSLPGPRRTGLRPPSVFGRSSNKVGISHEGFI